MRLPDPPAGLESGAAVWIYLRYSSEHQTIESQAHTMRQWCAQHNLLIAREFRDEARSGKTDAGRDGFNSLIAAVEHGDARDVRAVLFWSFARMARNTNDAEYFKSLLRKRGLIVFTLADDIPQGALAPVFEAFKHVQDADYRQRLSDEIKRGLEYRISKGVPHSGHNIPIGYIPGERVYLGPRMKRVNGVLKQVGERYAHRLTQDPETRDRVARAWRMMLNGENDYQIFKATHVACSHAALGHFFASVTYAGAVRCGDLINWDAHPAYVTRAEWERVQTMRRERAPHPSNPERHPRRLHNPQNLLSGILFCGVCGLRLTYGQARYTRYVRCRNHVDRGCAMRNMKAGTIHDAVINWLQQTVFTSARLIELRDEINAALNGDRAQLQSARDETLQRAARLDAEIRNMVEHVKRYGPDADINAALQRARAERTRARHELDAIETDLTAQRVRVSDEVLTWLAANLATEIRHAAPERVRDLIKNIVRRIELHTDDTLKLSYSIQPLLVSHRKASLQSGFPLNTCPDFNCTLQTAQLTLVRSVQRQAVQHA